MTRVQRIHPRQNGKTTAVLAARERAIDRVMAAPGFDDQRSEAIAVIDEHGDFRVELPDGRVVGVSALPKWIRDRRDRVTRDQVRAAAVTSC